MSLITNWVREVFIIILSITFLEIILPDGSMKKYIKFIYSMVIMAVILGPFCNFIHK